MQQSNVNTLKVPGTKPGKNKCLIKISYYYEPYTINSFGGCFKSWPKLHHNIIPTPSLSLSPLLQLPLLMCCHCVQSYYSDTCNTALAVAAECSMHVVLNDSSLITYPKTYWEK